MVRDDRKGEKGKYGEPWLVVYNVDSLLYITDRNGNNVLGALFERTEENTSLLLRICRCVSEMDGR